MDKDNFNDEIPQKSPLSRVVHNYADIFRLLLGQEDIQPNLPDSRSQIPLILACNSSDEELVGLLLERGIAIDPHLRAPGHIFSPLTVAAFYEHEDVIKLLLTRNDMNPNIHSHDGLTAL